MICSDFHMHTIFCDGNNTPEEMVLSAIVKGMKRIGICVHSYIPAGESYCVKKENVDLFIKTCKELKEKYKYKIEVYCGVEQDYFSDYSTDGFDYVIGSVHYVLKDGKLLDIDLSEQDFVNSVNTYYNGDFYAYCEDYYNIVSDVCEKTKCDFIGHFDLVTKFNEGGKLFDETHPRYVSAYKKAIDNLIKYNVPFEINSGAVSRGYRTTPYPNPDIIDYIKEKGGRFILSSDAHSAIDIGYNFENMREKA